MGQITTLWRGVDMDQKKIKSALKKAETKGRNTDTIIGHLTAGEVVIPRDFMKDPKVKEAVYQVFSKYGVDPEEFTAGSGKNKINPETGQPEFFLKKVVSTISNFVSSVFGGLAKPDTGPAERQLEEQRKENARLKQQQEEERRELSEQAAARQRARLRGGSRMLLSGARVNPEEGLTTLGSVGGQS
jgi:hypothetical protein